jgi:cold shock protein
MDGLWRFAAPSSFSGFSQHQAARRSGRQPRKEQGMPIGTVKFFNTDKGYGFIQPDDGGNDAFVHISAVQAAGMATLDRDQRVSYELEQDRRGKVSAVNLQGA